MEMLFFVAAASCIRSQQIRLHAKSYRDLCSVKMKFFIEFCIETSDPYRHLLQIYKMNNRYYIIFRKKCKHLKKITVPVLSSHPGTFPHNVSGFPACRQWQFRNW